MIHINERRHYKDININSEVVKWRNIQRIDVKIEELGILNQCYSLGLWRRRGKPEEVNVMIGEKGRRKIVQLLCYLKNNKNGGGFEGRFRDLQKFRAFPFRFWVQALLHRSDLEKFYVSYPFIFLYEGK